MNISLVAMLFSWCIHYLFRIMYSNLRTLIRSFRHVHHQLSIPFGDSANFLLLLYVGLFLVLPNGCWCCMSVFTLSSCYCNYIASLHIMRIIAIYHEQLNLLSIHLRQSPPLRNNISVSIALSWKAACNSSVRYTKIQIWHFWTPSVIKNTWHVRSCTQSDDNLSSRGRYGLLVFDHGRLLILFQHSWFILCLMPSLFGTTGHIIFLLNYIFLLWTWPCLLIYALYWCS